MDEAAARVTAMFEDLAQDYDRSGVDFFVPIAAGLLQRVPPAADQRWLDVGCGPGAVLLPAAAGVGPAGRAVGIDVAAAMVERARTAADELGPLTVIPPNESVSTVRLPSREMRLTERATGSQQTSVPSRSKSNPLVPAFSRHTLLSPFGVNW
jgi:SAM-dependent methyltransferase